MNGSTSGSPAVAVTDFERSCVRWRIDTLKKPVLTVSRKLPMTLNNVRAPLEARTVITEKSTGRIFEYVLTASCKTEQVWVTRDIWHQPNSDMCMIAGRDEFMIYKRWAKVDQGMMLDPPTLGVQPERHMEDPTVCFDTYSLNLTQRTGQVLESVDAILEALSDTTPVVAQTEYATATHQILLEYPVKIVNFSERERYYQVDTGPILVPDIQPHHKSPLEGCRTAFIAHNSPDWAELIVCVPTPLTESLKVHHYSESLRIDHAVNRMIAIR